MYTLDIEKEVKNIKTDKRNKEGYHENINFLILIPFIA